jgi:hypothetical protein
MFAQRMPHFCHGANFVVCHGVDHQGHATDAISLIANFFVMDPLQIACGFVDVALDGVGGHIGRFGLLYSQTQAGVDIHVSPTTAGSDHDFTDDAGPNFASLFVLSAFAVLDIGPFAVSCHLKSFF